MNEGTENVGCFGWALHHMKQGAAAKRIGWLGYWKVENPKPRTMCNIDIWDDPESSKPPKSSKPEIVMHCKDGSVVHMNSGCDSVFTAENMAANDWMILTDEQVAELDKVIASRCLAR